ncbi:MAG: hypothetical protein AB4426_09655 [Xenococcaceae cyanobacterium]
MSRFTNLITILVVTAASSVFAPAAAREAMPAGKTFFVHEGFSVHEAFSVRKAFSEGVGVGVGVELIAQTELTNSPPVPLESIPDAMERAFFYESGTSLENYTIGSQLNLIFGWMTFPEGSYPENQITRDAGRFHTIYRDAMIQQGTSDPMIRTRDLRNPFDTSLRQNPSYISPLPSGVQRDFVIEERPLFR